MLDNLRKTIADIPNQRKKTFDVGIFIIVCCLCIFGIIMIWSSSMYNAKLSGDEFAYVKKQLLYFAVGLMLMLFFSVLNTSYLKAYSNFFMAFALLLLFIVMLKPADESVKGAVRSIELAGIVIQPAEFTKISVLFFMAYQIERRTKEINSFKIFCLTCLYIAVTAYIIYQQPALSTAIIIAVTIIGMYFIAGGNFLYICIVGGMAIAAVYVFITQNPWRMERIMAFKDPFADLQDSGWQPAQSLMALGSGGIFGQGIGNGRAKLGFLPELQNDYIFSVIGEELGLVGCVALIIVYFILISKILKLAFKAPGVFEKMFCGGAAILLAVQVFLNIGVVTNLLPSTGIILPFISSGGSSLFTFMIIIGVVLNISRNIKTPRVGRRERNR